MFYVNDYVKWTRADLEREFIVAIAPRNSAPGIIEDAFGMRYIASEDELIGIA